MAFLLKIDNMLFFLSNQICKNTKLDICSKNGNKNTFQDSFFTILVEVFSNHNLAENIFFMNDTVNRTEDYGR